MTDKIKIFDFTLTPQEAQDGKAVDLLISKLRPDWQKDKIHHKVFSGGQVNCMMQFYYEDKKNEGIVVRIFNAVAALLTDHDNEAMCMQLAHHQKCFPEVFAFFENGMAYAFSPGRLLTIKEFEKHDIARIIVRSLCDFHNADMHKIPVVDRHGKPSKFNTSFTFYSDMRRIARNAPEQLTAHEDKAPRIIELGLSRTVILKEIDVLEKLLVPLDLPMSITHYDYHQRNGIFCDDTGKLIILDLEMVKVGYEAFDIGGLFVEGPWRRLVPHFYDESGGEPAVYTEELKWFYAREYITRKYEIQNRDPGDVTEDVIRLQYLEHELMAAAFHLFWVLAFVVAIDFAREGMPTVKVMGIEWDLYKKSMDEFPEVRRKYLSQRAKVESQ